MDEVVVLPCVPAIASVSRSELSAPSTSARVATRMPRDAATCSSTLSVRTAGECVTSSTSPTFEASWPMATSTPACVSEALTCEATRSEPLTEWPRPTSTRASPLMPAPPTPTTWIRLVPRSSIGSAGMFHHHLGDPSRSIGPTERPGCP